MASAFGAGAAVTALASGGLRRRVNLAHLAPLGLTVFAGGLGALALAPAPGWAVAATALAGAGMILAITSLTTQLQARLPEHLRGRVMALWMVAFIGSRPLAAAINGGVADVASARLALVVGVAVLLAGATVVRPRAVARAAPAADAA
jgi:MFS family permease